MASLRPRWRTGSYVQWYGHTAECRRKGGNRDVLQRIVVFSCVFFFSQYSVLTHSIVISVYKTKFLLEEWGPLCWQVQTDGSIRSHSYYPIFTNFFFSSFFISCLSPKMFCNIWEFLMKNSEFKQMSNKADNTAYLLMSALPTMLTLWSCWIKTDLPSSPSGVAKYCNAKRNSFLPVTLVCNMKRSRHWICLSLPDNYFLFATFSFVQNVSALDVPLCREDR